MNILVPSQRMFAKQSMSVMTPDADGVSALWPSHELFGARKELNQQAIRHIEKGEFIGFLFISNRNFFDQNFLYCDGDNIYDIQSYKSRDYSFIYSLEDPYKEIDWRSLCQYEISDSSVKPPSGMLSISISKYWSVHSPWSIGEAKYIRNLRSYVSANPDLWRKPVKVSPLYPLEQDDLALLSYEKMRDFHAKIGASMSWQAAEIYSSQMQA